MSRKSTSSSINSRKKFNRKNYQRLLLKKGDELYIKTIDRLGYDYNVIMEQRRYLVKKKISGNHCVRFFF